MANCPPCWPTIPSAANRVPAFKEPSAEFITNYHLENRDFTQTEFALVGTVVAVRETLKLAQQRLDSRAALGVLFQKGVENGIRNLVGDFIRMAFADTL